tara:strand:- start:89 stop:1069 length:981 start_codon:yes stop_codon:yes gene_type:complete
MNLIIGGSGFVGSFLIRKLGKNNILNIDKEPSYLFSDKTKIGNILNKNDLKFNSEIDTVILLAAEHKDNVTPVSLYYDVNVQGTKNVLDAMDKASIKNLVFTSSVAVYGLNKLNPDEIITPDPFNHYGKSKLKAEDEIKKWYENDPNGKSVTIIRPTVIFGENNRGNVFNLLNQIASYKFLMIGNGINKKSMAYVRNIVSFIKFILNKKKLGYNVYNYSDTPDLTMKELVAIVEKRLNLKTPSFYIPYILGVFIGYLIDFFSFLLKKKFTISSIRIKKFCATTQFSSKKVSKIFKPKYSLKEALNKTIDHEFKNSKNKNDHLFFSE